MTKPSETLCLKTGPKALIHAQIQFLVTKFYSATDVPISFDILNLYLTHFAEALIFGRKACTEKSVQAIKLHQYLPNLSVFCGLKQVRRGRAA